MSPTIACACHLSDEELLTRVRHAAHDERAATALLIALLMELDARRLYLREGYSSLFTYCTDVLCLSEHAAYGRIEAARAARRFPMILEGLADGTLTLTTIGLLAPHLMPANCVDLLEEAKGKKKREIEHLVARLRPQPDVPATVRKLPEPKPADTSPAAVVERPADSSAMPLAVQAIPQVTASPRIAVKNLSEMKPLAPERYKIQFTVSRDTYEQLRHAQNLLRHTIPNGDPAAIFERALALLVTELERTKLAVVKHPRTTATTMSRSRHIRASVKRAVWQRDGGQCAFIGTDSRCRERGFLEFHHVVPFAAGGETSAQNLQLRCRAHNAYEAEQSFGLAHTPRARETRECC